MIHILLGFTAFLLFFLYDINSVRWEKSYFRPLFFVGLIMLAFSTAGMAIFTENSYIRQPGMIIYGAIALIFLLLLIHALFFAIPFQNTYVHEFEKKKVCRDGVYALCRHPGVLWFMGFYLFLWLALPSPLLLTAAVLYSALNILYAFFQDRWTFLQAFDDYSDYKLTTPFLIPTVGSVKRCAGALRGKKVTW